MLPVILLVLLITMLWLVLRQRVPERSLLRSLWSFPRLALLHLGHQEPQSLQQGQDILAAPIGILHLTLLVGFSVVHLFQGGPTRLLWFAVVHEQGAALELHLVDLLTSSAGPFAVVVADEGRVRLRDPLDVLEATKRGKEVGQLLIGGLLIDILDHQVQHLHRLLELVALFGQLILPLVLGLRLSDVQLDLFWLLSLLFSDLLEGFLRILPVLKADEAEPSGDVVLVLHDNCRDDLSIRREKLE